MWPLLGLVSILIVPLVGQPQHGWDNATETFASSPCSSPIGSMDSVVVVESKSGDRLDFTTIQVCKSVKKSPFATFSHKIYIELYSFNFEHFGRENSKHSFWVIVDCFHFLRCFCCCGICFFNGKIPLNKLWDTKKGDKNVDQWAW